jgi:hypothetical protein
MASCARLAAYLWGNKMPTPECYADIGALKARVDLLEQGRESDAEKIAELTKERARIGGAVWALSFVFSAALYVLINGVPGFLKRLFG